jgi:hypothetical protein
MGGNITVLGAPPVPVTSKPTPAPTSAPTTKQVVQTTAPVTPVVTGNGTKLTPGDIAAAVLVPILVVIIIILLVAVFLASRKKNVEKDRKLQNIERELETKEATRLE